MVPTATPAETQAAELVHHGAEDVGHHDREQHRHDDFADAPEHEAGDGQEEDQHQGALPSGTSFGHGYPLREIQMAMPLQTSVTA